MEAKILLSAALVIVAVAASALDVTFPPETATLKASNLPGYQLAEKNCMACHSTHYMQMQPTSSRKYWDATVKKMKQPYGAQFPDEDIPAMVDYLVKTYGAEREAKTPMAQK
ncbi:MAG TPA: cytochrome c [Burkholderiaceae bacterium]|nr:cytochrome c [Burkholderiaceae bacterium]